MRSVVGPFFPGLVNVSVSCAVATQRGPLPSFSREPRFITNFTLCTQRPPPSSLDHRPPTTDLKNLTFLPTQTQPTDNSNLLSYPRFGIKSDPPEHLHCSDDPTRPYPFHPPQADPLLCPISPIKTPPPLTGSRAAAKQQPKPTSPWARHFLSPSLKRYVRTGRRHLPSRMPPFLHRAQTPPSSLDGCLCSRGTRYPTSTPFLDLTSPTRLSPMPCPQASTAFPPHSHLHTHIICPA